MRPASDAADRPRRPGIHRGWIMLAVVTLYYSALSGLMLNCSGIIFAAVIKDMGFKSAELFLYYTVRSFSCAFIAKRMCRSFDKAKRPNAFVAMTGIAAAASYAVMPLYTKVWQWYLSAMLIASACAEMIYVVSVVINNWFKKNQGTLIGFALTGAGVCAAVASPVLSAIIEGYGWRMACLAVAGMAIAAWVIPCFFLLVRSPEEIGEKAVGDETASEKTPGQTARHDQVTPPSEKMWPLLLLAISLPGAVSIVNNQLPTFATSTGYALSVGATISSFSMVGNMSFKMLLGMASDRVGAVNATRVFLGISVIGFLCILNANGNQYVIYAGALLFGAIFACVVTAPTLICKEMYGDELYKDRLSRNQTLYTMLSAITAFIYPEIYDILGTWTPVFILCAVICVITIICLTIVQNHVKRLRAVQPAQQRT